MIKNSDFDIQIEESIKRHKIAYSQKYTHFVFDKLFYILLLLLFIYVFIRDVILSNTINSINDILSFSLFAIVGFFILSILALKTDELIRLKGQSKKTNRETVLLIMKEIDWKIIFDATKITVVEPDSAYQMNGGVQFTIIYDDEDILINCSTYHFGNAISPFHLFNNRMAIREFKRVYFTNTPKGQ